MEAMLLLLFHAPLVLAITNSDGLTTISRFVVLFSAMELDGHFNMS